jgi:hypothetical protein
MNFSSSDSVWGKVASKWRSYLVTLFTGVLFASCNSNSDGDLRISFTNFDTGEAIDAKTIGCSESYDYFWDIARLERCLVEGGICSRPVAPTASKQGPYVNLGSLQLQWVPSVGKDRTQMDQFVRVVYLRFRFQSPSLSGGKWTFDLAADDLGKIWRRFSPLNEFQVLLPEFPPVETEAVFDEVTGKVFENKVQSPLVRVQSDDDTGTVWKTALRTSQEILSSDCEVAISGIPFVDKTRPAVVSGTVFVYGVLRDKATGRETPITTSTNVTFKWRGTF